MISASKITLSQNNLKILWPKVTKNLTHLHKTFCESPPWVYLILKAYMETQWGQKHNDKESCIRFLILTTIYYKTFHGFGQVKIGNIGLI